MAGVKSSHFMNNAVELDVGGVSGPILQHQHRAFSGRKILLQGQDLPPIAQGILGQ